MSQPYFLDRLAEPSPGDCPSPDVMPRLLELTTRVAQAQFQAEFVWTCLRVPGEESIPLSTVGRPSVPSLVCQGDRLCVPGDLSREVVAMGSVSFHEATIDVLLGREGRPFSRAEGSRFKVLMRRAQRALDEASAWQSEQAVIFQESVARRRDRQLRAMQRALGKFSHDLINDLTPLIYLAEELELAGERADVVKLALQLERQCARMRHRLRHELQACVGEPRTRAADWATVFRDLAESWQAAFAHQGLDLSVLAPAESLRVRASESDLVTVTSNLLSNAQKYTPPGGFVEARLAIEGDCALLEVSDTGRGISPDLQRDLFESGSREYPEIEGSGVGLKQVSTLIRDLGGHIEVESQPGLGATFRVYLPREKS